MPAGHAFLLGRRTGPKTTAVALVALMGLTVVARLTFLAFFPPIAPYSDMGVYDAHAWRLAQGAGYVGADGLPTAYWPPGYPLFLSSIYLLCGHVPECGYLANIVLSCLIVAIVYFLCLVYTGSTPISLLMGLMMAFYPDSIAYSGLLLSDLLYTFLILLGVALTIASMYRFRCGGGAFIPALSAGFVFGAAVLVRPLAILLAPVVILVLLIKDCSSIAVCSQARWVSPSRASLWLLICLMLIGAALPVGAWSIRNYVVFDRLVLVSTNGGINLLIGNHSLATGTYTDNDQIVGLLDQYPDEVERDSLARQKAARYISENMAYVITALVPQKLWHMFRDAGDGFAFTWRSYSLIPFGDPEWEASPSGFVAKALVRLRSMAYLFILAGFCGYCILMIPGRLVWLPLAVTIYHTMITAIFFGVPRYREPLIPFWLIGIACALGFMLSIRRESRRDLQHLR